MNVAAYIAKRVAFNTQKSFSRFVIRLSVGATIISVAVMILTLAFTNGFKETISQKVFSFWGHIRIQGFGGARVSIAEEAPIFKNDSVTNLPKQFPQITSVQPFATRSAILKTEETIEGVLIKGVEAGYHFNNLGKFLVSGRWVQFGDSSYAKEINLSEFTANRLHLKAGDSLQLYFIQPGSPARARKVMVAGIFKTGIEEYDKMIAIGDLRLLQRLNGWAPDQIGGYELMLNDYNAMDEVNYEIISALPMGMRGTTIRNLYPNIFDWLGLQNKTIAIVLIIMVVIATLNLITCLLILVMERIRMVGLLKALGASNWMIQKIFLFHGAVIICSGLLFGNLIGLVICWLQQRYSLITLPEDAYYISKIEVHIVWWQVALVNAGTFLICFLVLLIPTIIVKRVQPVRAIQFR
ncbi:ABC transporter permease [Pseudoflavitalea sp. G-6-1-2]|uniref:ABC transporter permease n=1 Tax=Pseudoflavitalea sp. G-6-1-2 TaxID=2728841 RepID=UPI00146E6F8F|nr:FtsX-like permease family protein [Pseudoflavitalea sp. G-6-1-2]NML22514.1 ABC transporter permease [Pseudoflavitalea sp. G-6-1-2]